MRDFVFSLYYLASGKRRQTLLMNFYHMSYGVTRLFHRRKPRALKQNLIDFHQLSSFINTFVYRSSAVPVAIIHR